MYPRRIVFLFLCCFLFLGSNAQTGAADSLKKLLAKASGTEHVRLLCELAWTIRSSNNAPQVKAYARQAYNEAQKLNDKKGQAEALHKIGIGYYYADTYDTASSYYEQSYILARQIGDSSLAAQALGGTGNVYRVQGLYDQAVPYLKRAVAIYRKNNDKTNLGSYLTYLGDCYLYQNDFDNAEKNYRDALDMAQKSGDNYTVANSMFGLGNSNAYRGQFQKAIDWYEKSIPIADKIGNQAMISNSLAAEADAYRSLYNFPKTIETYLRAKKIAEKNNDQLNLAYVYSGLSDMYFTQRSIDTAKYYQNKSIAIARQIGDNNRLCSSLLTLADINAANHDTAAMPATTDEATSLAQLNQYDSHIAHGFRNKATVALWKKNYTQTESLLAQALTLADSAQDNQGRAEIYRILTDCYLRQSKTAEAIVSGDSAFAIAGRIGARGTQMDCALLLSKAHERRGEFSDALTYYKKVKELNDTINSPERTRNQTQQLMQYYFEKEQEHQRAEQARKEIEAKAREQRLTLIVGFGTVVLALLLIFMFFIYRGYRQKQRANIIITTQKKIVEEKNREVTESIQYASHIQQALLPPAEAIAQIFPEHFVFFRPRDIVGGDFYWVHERDDLKFFVVGDCTGHGVPGGFMSTLGITFLNEIIVDMQRSAPAEILDLLRNYVIGALNKTKKSGEQLSRDGMDIALCVIDTRAKKLHFSGANNGLYLIRGSTVGELMPDKQPIGVHEQEKPFTQTSIDIDGSITIVATTDGYPDQFGGDRGKKLLYNRFKKVLLDCQSQPIDRHARLLEAAFDQWKASHEQVDDVCVMGVRVG